MLDFLPFEYFIKKNEIIIGFFAAFNFFRYVLVFYELTIFFFFVTLFL